MKFSTTCNAEQFVETELTNKIYTVRENSCDA